MAPNDGGTVSEPAIHVATQLHAFNVMPRPGQANALEFDGSNVTEWLEEWNLQCEDYGVTDLKKCTRLPYYCVSSIKDVVKLLPGYMSEPPDWTVLQSDLKELYWQLDKPKNTTTALYQLIHDSQTGKIPLNVYVLKYTSISNSLVTKGALSLLDRVGRLLDGLPEDLRRKVLKFCTKKKWKLSSQDIGTSDPVYKELEDFVLTEARSLQKETVYNKEKAMRDGRPEVSYSTKLDQPSPTSTSTPSATVPTSLSVLPPASSPSASNTTTPTTVDSIAELTKQFSQMVLAVTAGFTNLQQAQAQTTAQRPTLGATSTVPTSRPPRPQRCLHCDSLDHMRRECKEFEEALRTGMIHWGGNGRIINSATGLELPLMFGKGGMKALLQQQPAATPATTPTSVSSNNIVLNSRYGSIGEGTVLTTTLDFENNVRIDEIIDVEVNEKRKRGNLDQARRLRSRIDDTPTPQPRKVPQSVQMEEVTDEDMPDLPVQPRRQVQTPRAPVTMPAPTPILTTTPIELQSPTTEATKKYKLASEVSQIVGTSQIGEKIMDTPVQLSIREILAVSGDVAGYLHDQTRKRRVPLDNSTAATEITTTDSTTSPSPSVSTASVNSSELKSYYALPSGRAKVTIDDRFTVNALLDNGSEVNMMPRRVFEQLNLPIDTEIRWQINAYNTDTNLEDCGPIGVCHDVLISIGGVETRQHIFVVETANSDLLLGRPWERAVRAEFVNEEDGSYTVRIKSRDGRRHVQFTAVTAEHDRNREYVRHPEDTMVNRINSQPLKG